MKMQIKNVEKKKSSNNKDYAVITDSQGNKYGCWNKELIDSFVINSYYNVQTKVDGKFTTITGLESETPEEIVNSDDELEPITKGLIYKKAMDLYTSDTQKWKPAEAVQIAKNIWELM